jgi:hypothetical protein
MGEYRFYLVGCKKPPRAAKQYLARVSRMLLPLTMHDDHSQIQLGSGPPTPSGV